MEIDFILILDPSFKPVFVNKDLLLFIDRPFINNTGEFNTDPPLKKIAEECLSEGGGHKNYIVTYYANNFNRSFRFRADVEAFNTAGQKHIVINLKNDAIVHSENLFPLPSSDENTGDAVALTDLEYKLVYLTETAKKIFVAAEWKPGHDFREFLDLHINNEEKDLMERTLASNHKWKHSFEITSSGKSKGFITLEAEVSNGFSGNINGYFFKLLNSKKTSEATTTSKEYNSFINGVLNGVSGHLVIITKKGSELCFGNADEAFLKEFGIARETSAGLPLKMVFNDNLFTKVMDAVKSVSLGNPSYFRYNLPSEDKRQYGAKLSFVELRGGSESIYLLSLRDISKIMEFEEKLKKAYTRETYLNRLKSAFLQNLSHEIRTPYNSIVSYTDLIDEFAGDQDFDSLRELLKSSREVLKKVLNLFNNVLEVAQIESGEIELNTEPININTIIASVYSNKKADADSKGIALRINLPEDDLVIETDWIRIEKVLSILIDNSITTTYSGGVEVSAFEEDGNVHINISDTGNGIDEDELKTLLEPAIDGENGFYSSEGVGLGLPIALHLVRLMNGVIEVSSLKRKGTTINLTFPSVKI